jgi:hypothetical protein
LVFVESALEIWLAAVKFPVLEKQVGKRGDRLE